jgi:hypothetical protein
MWEWLLNELQKAVKALKVNSSITSVDEDDIVSIVAIYLFQNKTLATKIYNDKNIGLLYKLVRHEIYEQKSKMFFENKMELSWYQRIIAVCEKYDIEPVPANAYKISALLEDTTTSKNFSIAGIVDLLSSNTLPHNLHYENNKNL